MCERLREQRLKIVAASFDKHFGNALVRRERLCGFRLDSIRLTVSVFKAVGEFDKPVGCILTAVEDNVFDSRFQVVGHLAIRHQRRSVDDSHIETGTDSVVEKNGVHSLADIVVAAEREREIAHASADLCAREILLNPTGCVDKVECVSVVPLDAGRHGEDVRVENDVDGVESDRIDENTVCAAANSNATLERVGLTLFVERHNDHGGTHRLDKARMFDKRRFALFEADGVDYTFALQAFKSGLDDVPLRRIEHERHARDVGVGRKEVDEMTHLRLGVEHSVVHINVDDLCAVFDLSSSDVARLIVVFFVDKSQKLTAARHVTSFADVDEIAFGGNVDGVESCEGETLRNVGHDSRTVAACQVGERADVFGRRAAASADDVRRAIGKNTFDVSRHHLRRFVVFAQCVRQSGVRVDDCRESRFGGKFGDERSHRVGAEAAV